MGEGRVIVSEREIERERVCVCATESILPAMILQKKIVLRTPVFIIP